VRSPAAETAVFTVIAVAAWAAHDALEAVRHSPEAAAAAAACFWVTAAAVIAVIGGVQRLVRDRRRQG
jgi:hypothetical protein